MIPVIIFWLHITAGTYLFVRKYYEETLGEAFLILTFAGIIFTAGWTLSSFLVRLVLGPQGFGEIFNDDSVSLILLTLLEIIIYRIWFGRPKERNPGSA